MTPHLRPARSTDAGFVGGLLTEFTAHTAWMPNLHTAAQDIGHAGRMIDRGWVTVAAYGDQKCGFIARDGVEVNALYVQADMQGQKIGSTLLKAAQAEVDCLELWTFEANTAAQRFYDRHGFTVAERTDGAGNDENLPDIRYVWRRKGSTA